jgi:mono/diheme cytochrome c family protein
MGEAIDESLSHLKIADVTAMVAYLRTVPSVVSSDLPAPRATPAAVAQTDVGNVRGKEVYEGACAGCHGWPGVSPVIRYASLTDTRSVNDPTGNNVAQVIIGGGKRHYRVDAENMPAFGGTYSDAEIAAVANYVTSLFGTKGADLTASRIAELRAQD